MGEYSLREYYDMFRALIRVNEDFSAAPDEYSRIVENPLRVPQPATFRTLRDRILKTGSLLPDHKSAGRKRTRISDQVRADVLRRFEENPQLSTRLCAVRLGIAHQDVHTILSEEGLHPFHFTKTQQLLGPRDYNLRVQFAQHFLNQRLLVPDYQKIILWSDECSFTPEGMFNQKNYVNWTDRNPHLVAQVNSQFKWTINVWAGIIDNKLVSYFATYIILNLQKIMIMNYYLIFRLDQSYYQLG